MATLVLDSRYILPRVSVGNSGREMYSGKQFTGEIFEDYGPRLRLPKELGPRARDIVEIPSGFIEGLVRIVYDDLLKSSLGE